MEKKLHRLFDFQRFQGNEKLSAMIGDVEARYGRALSDDDLELVSAAGEAEASIVVSILVPGEYE